MRRGLFFIRTINSRHLKLENNSDSNEKILTEMPGIRAYIYLFIHVLGFLYTTIYSNIVEICNCK